MSKNNEIIENIANAEYQYGFESNIEQEFIPKGLNEDIIRLISSKKQEPEWLLEFRLKAFERWKNMDTPGNKQLVVYIPDALGKIPKGNLEITVNGQNGDYVKTILIPEQKNMQAGFVYTITADLVKE